MPHNSNRLNNPHHAATPLLAVEHLSVVLQKHGVTKTLVDDLSFDVYPQQSLGLLGDSGSGKSLTALSLLQLLPHPLSLTPQSRLRLEGKDLFPCSPQALRAYRRKAFGIVFQDPGLALNPVLKIDTQLQEAMPPGTPRAERVRRLEQVELRDPQRVLNAYPFELSGGMQQRVLIAMALGRSPQLLILDEPTTGLDKITQKSLILLLQRLQASGLTLLIISHDAQVVGALAHTRVYMANGKRIEPSAAQIAPPTDTPPTTTGPAPSLHTLVLSAQALFVSFPIKQGFFRRTVGHTVVLDDVSFDLHAHRTLAIVGESGSGKTTLAKTLTGLITQTRGVLRVVNAVTVQMIFQNAQAAMNPRFSVAEVLLEGLLSIPANLKLTASQREQQCIHLLTQVGLNAGHLTGYPHELSGGQKQRVCIARALATKPKILVCDEPTSSLDVNHQTQILNLLVGLQETLGIALVFITHDIRLAKRIAHQTLVLQQGRVVEFGPTERILTHPEHAYTQQLLAASVL